MRGTAGAAITAKLAAVSARTEIISEASGLSVVRAYPNERGGNAAFVGFFPGSGRLTSLLPVDANGVSPFYVHDHNQTLTLNSSVVDNGTAPVRLVMTVYNGGQITLASSTNSYTGGTVINGWGPSGGSSALTLGAGAYLPAGGLTLSSADFTQKLGDARKARGASAHHLAPACEGGLPIALGRRGDILQDCRDLRGAQLCAFGEIAAFILAARPEQFADLVGGEFVELVDGPDRKSVV